MLLSRPFYRSWLVALAMMVCLGTIVEIMTPSDVTAQQQIDCASFLDPDDAQVAFDADPTDPFGLDGDNDGGSKGNDPEVLDGVPPAAPGRTATTSPVAVDTSQTLEARLEARFAALEAQFAAFELRAGNDFGRFPDSSDDATAGGQTSTVMVSKSQQPVTIAQRPGANNDGPI